MCVFICTRCVRNKDNNDYKNDQNSKCQYKNLGRNN